jgi:hypothetical protein
VIGLDLEPNTIVYYYIYGSVLAALSRQSDNQCPEALQVMQEVRDELDANPDAYTDGRETIISIVEAAEQICASLAAGDQPPGLEVTPEATVEGSIEEGTMIDVTATPAQ